MCDHKREDSQGAGTRALISKARTQETPDSTGGYLEDKTQTQKTRRRLRTYSEPAWGSTTLALHASLTNSEPPLEHCYENGYTDE
ncbi:MAG: hypothetical protein Aurels2KO_39870 [Aureliella sp.]